MGKAFSNQTPGLIRQLGQQFGESNRRKEAQTMRNRKSALGKAWIDYEDKTPTGMIKFAQDNDMGIEEVTEMSDTMKKFQSWEADRIKAEQGAVDRTRKLGQQVVTDEQTAYDIGQRGDEEATALASRNETIAKTALLNAQAGNVGKVKPSTAEPQVPAGVRSGLSMIKTAVGQDKFGAVTGDNAVALSAINREFLAETANLSPAELKVQGPIIAQNKIDSFNQQKEDIENLPAPKKGKLGFGDAENIDEAIVAVQDAHKSGAGWEGIAERLKKRGWEEAEVINILESANMNVDGTITSPGDVPPPVAPPGVPTQEDPLNWGTGAGA